MKRLSPETAVGAVILAVLVINVGLCSLRVAYDTFGRDELQHMHLAWLAASGKVLYKDFWDTHGPTYTLLNGFIVRHWSGGPGVELMLYLRALSALALGGILVLTFLIARRLSLSRNASLAAAAVFVSLLFVQDAGTELRPDGLQNLFWLAGLYLVLSNQPSRSRRYLVLAGLFFGLAILTNAKAALGPLFVVVYYFVAGCFLGVPFRDIKDDLLALVAGGLSAYAIWLVYFFWVGAVMEFHFFNAVWNLAALKGVQGETTGGKSLALRHLGFFMEKQLPFLLLSVLGVLLWFSDLVSGSGGLDKRRGWLMGLATAGTTLGWGLNMLNQFFLVFLPLLSIMTSYAIFRVSSAVSERGGVAGSWAIAIFVAISTAYMLGHSLKKTAYEERPGLAFQKRFTERVLAVSARSEPLGVVWNNCGGYMFNENLQFFWAADARFGRQAERWYGKNPFGEQFISLLEGRKVRFVVGRDKRFFRGLPDKTTRYIKDNFVYDECLWIRKG